LLTVQQQSKWPVPFLSLDDRACLDSDLLFMSGERTEWRAMSI
jgi:hypothetical protein